MQIAPKALEQYWTSILAAVEALGGQGQEARIEKPASHGAIEAVESKLGHKLPETFKEVLIGFSGSATFQWHLPENFQLPDEFTGIFCGDIHWSLDRLMDVEENRRNMVRECFPDPKDLYDQHWHNKLAFYEVGNGDCLAVDLSDQHAGAIVYLSGGDGEGHGLKMANSFGSLIQNWSLIGGVGGEDWQWLPFYDRSASTLDPRGQAAQRFRDLIGFDLEENF